MTINGDYYFDGNFYNVFSGNRLYTIPVNDPGNWACVDVGDDLPYGGSYTAQMHAEGLARITGNSTFVLS